MQVDLSEKENISIFTVSGRIDTQTSNDLDNAITPVIDGKSINVIIDLAGVEYISSSGLRVLLGTLKKLTASGGKLKLSALTPFVKNVFAMSGFQDIFEIYPSCAEAEAAFK